MNEPQPEYRYRFVAQTDLQPGDEHWTGNRWAICDAGYGTINGTVNTCAGSHRRRRILPPERMRILGLKEHLADYTKNKFTLDGITWKPLFKGNDFTTEEVINLYPNIRILAIAAPIAVESKAPKTEAKGAIPPTRTTWVNCPVCGDCDMKKTLDWEDNAIIECTNHACASNGGDNFDGIESSRTCKPIWNRVAKDCLPEPNKPCEIACVEDGKRSLFNNAPDWLAGSGWTHWRYIDQPQLPEKDKPEWEVEFDTACDICKTPDFVRTFSKQIYKTALVAAKRKPSILESVKEEQI